jgi:thioredoxin:protein disulfide reductase
MNREQTVSRISRRDARWFRAFSRWAAMAIALGAIVYAPGMASAQGAPAAPELRWLSSEPEALRAARARGRPVLIDFWADWCEACEALDRFVWSDPRVRDEARRFVALRIDGSESSPAVKSGRFDRAADRYGIAGLPTVILTDARGRELDRIAGVVSADEMLRRLRAAERACTVAMACR